jgi:hypothetical protein
MFKVADDNQNALADEVILLVTPDDAKRVPGVLKPGSSEHGPAGSLSKKKEAPQQSVDLKRGFHDHPQLPFTSASNVVKTSQ